MAPPFPPLRAVLADPRLPLMAAWIIGALLAIFIPVIVWSKKKNEYYSYYGYYNEYEQQQQNYENENNGNDNNNNNYGYTQCRWWQWKCRQQQYYYQQQYGSGDGDNNVDLPNWYLFIGGQTESDRRRQEEMGLDSGASGALKFVYAWSIIMFVAIVAYGAYVIGKGHPSVGLVVVLLLLLSFSLMNLIMVGQGVISSEGRDMEDSVYGWYGQMGVLLAYTDFWIMLYCIIFSIVFGVRMMLERRNVRRNANANNTNEDWDSTAYQNYDAPQVKMTSA